VPARGSPAKGFWEPAAGCQEAAAAPKLFPETAGRARAARGGRAEKTPHASASAPRSRPGEPGLVLPGGSSPADFFPSPWGLFCGCWWVSGERRFALPAGKVEMPLRPGLSLLRALSVQVLDPELEVADIAFPPSTISASSLKMQVSGAGRMGGTPPARLPSLPDTPIPGTAQAGAVAGLLRLRHSTLLPGRRGLETSRAVAVAARWLCGTRAGAGGRHRAAGHRSKPRGRESSRFLSVGHRGGRMANPAGHVPFSLESLPSFLLCSAEADPDPASAGGLD